MNTTAKKNEKLSFAEKREIISLREAGVNFSNISSVTGRSTPAIRKVLKANGIIKSKLYLTDPVKFLQNHTVVNEYTGCWEWQLGLNCYGYGQFRFNGPTTLVHRFSYLTHKGSIGEFHVLHKCDNRKCCNPDHLFLGTNKDNVDDRVRKGRHIGFRKFDKQKVVEIKRLLSSGIDVNTIADMFNVNVINIGYIKRGALWKNVK